MTAAPGDVAFLASLAAALEQIDRALIVAMLVALRDRVAISRAPDVLIGGALQPYMKRWWLVPRRSDGLNVYLHHFLRSDDDRALHDHPWANLSILIDGAYTEHTPDGAFRREAGDIAWRPAEACHRIALDPAPEIVPASSLALAAASRDVADRRPPERPCWSLFVTGPKVREWGFHCPRGWTHWKDFTGQDDRDGPVRIGIVSRGCD